MLQLILAFSILGQVWAIDWQGHRGARGLYPENTIGAMAEALKYPVTTLELDVVVSKDHKIIVSHEPWMSEEICMDPEGKRVKDYQYNIYKLTVEEIVKFDCGTLPHPRFPEQKKISVGKPTLEKLLEVTEARLKELNRSEIPYNIEIKSTLEDEKKGFQPPYKEFSDLVITRLKELLPLKKFTIQSFDWRVLKYIHEKYPDVRLVALTEHAFDPETAIKELGFSPYVFSPYFKDLSEEKVKKLHALNSKVIPWTVNTVEEMRDVKKMGVDGIITDYPNRISKALESFCQKGMTHFDGKCVKIPPHAVPSTTNPGWSCKSGYMQKRSRCIKINLPPHSHLNEDGKNWSCNEGYKPYRGTCKKQDS